MPCPSSDPVPFRQHAPRSDAPLHPADELHALRQQIRWLSARAESLADRLVAEPDRCGTDWEAVVTTRIERRLDEARLPLSVRADPRHFRDEAVDQVVLVPAGAVAPRRLADALPPPDSAGSPLILRTGNSAAPSAAPRPAGR